MSPVEALGMALFLGNQKLANEDFQVTPAEWAATRHQRNVAKWDAHKRGIPYEDKVSRPVSSDGNAKSRELMGLALKHGSDALTLIENSLDSLKIPR